ncbi:hypothetical protein CkaCkLH20_08691 [Colletotrichum karsti]|uniref:Uncharacterized protein n=1 Tax=Colletotrichum karsti TaxID=1095194 RepID=A0A9P6HZ17_9PEZI|nr:uncharacterized protein CkaCkLH20_08691 [Colletotrichum karsti]KAF9873957.1 hypothetical protein CkaCkLH20_08691 [Colletotrichum karsti]
MRAKDDISKLHLLVPGCPPVYVESEGMWPRKLEPDPPRNAAYYHRALYEGQSTTHVFETMLLAARATDRALRRRTSFDNVDIVISRGLLMSLLRRINGKDKHMSRFDIEMVHNTLFMTRPPQDGVVSREGHSYGHAFEKNATRLPPQLEHTEQCIRYVRYQFGSLNIVVQTDVDAAWGLSLKDMPTTEYIKSKTEARPDLVVEIARQFGGSMPLQSMAAEIKTVHIDSELNQDSTLTQMWFGRTPHLIVAQHRDGMFYTPEHYHGAPLLSAWEDQNQVALRKLVTLLEWLKRAALAKGRKCGVMSRANSSAYFVYDTVGDDKPFSEDVVQYFWSQDRRTNQEAKYGLAAYARHARLSREEKSTSGGNKQPITPGEFKQMFSAAREASQTGQGLVRSRRGKSTPRGEDKPITRDEAKQMLRQAGRDLSKRRQGRLFAKNGRWKNPGGGEWGNARHLERIRKAPKREIRREEPDRKPDTLPTVETPAIPDHGAWGQTFVQKFEEDRSALREQDPRRHAAKPLKFNRPKNPVGKTSTTGWGPESGVIPPIGRKEEGSE